MIRKTPLAVFAVLLIGTPGAARAADDHAAHSPPQHLSETGLFRAGSVTGVEAGVLAFSPQYPLWSDGATKRRWIKLPPNTFVDARNPDAWEFPAGTRLWKEFSHGRPIETRFIERLSDGSWRFATYVWNEQGTDAVLAPVEGMRAVAAKAAPGGTYGIPSQSDCRACHEGAAAPVLGFSALQLSSDRDPLAPHAEAVAEGALRLKDLAARGLVRNLPQKLIEQPPRIAAASPIERATLGYLHGNCGHCHDRPSETGAAVPVEAVLAQKVGDSKTSVSEVLRSVVGVPSRFRGAGMAAAPVLVAPGEAHASVLALRMSSRNPRVQMPPLGTAIPDREALALIKRWIDENLNQTKEN